MATLGPASDPPDVLDAMLLAGVDVVRINLSHGHLDGHIARLHAVREAATRTGSVVAVLADLPGPKVRAAPSPTAASNWRPERRSRWSPISTSSSCERDRRRLRDVAGGPSLRRPGRDRRWRDHARRRADHAGGRPSVSCAAAVTRRADQGVHLPSERLRFQTPTAKTWCWLRPWSRQGADFLAVSFVRGADDLRKVRASVAPLTTRLVAKIETLPAIEHLDEIIAASDAVMVARGDLGIECPLEDVPHMQKRIVRVCVEAGVPVITATQMMESMITAPSPTRAEVSDVANAVFDGTDALMLSAETAIGVDPVNVVRTMARVAERAERDADYAHWADHLGRLQRTAFPMDPIASRWPSHTPPGLPQPMLVRDAILCCTRSGRTALAMARFRPTARLIGLSPDLATVRALALSWGVESLQVETYTTTDELVWHAVESAVQHGLVSVGQTVLVLAGAPDRASGASTDVLRIVRVS